MIRYSEKIKGDRGNYDWQVRFDVTEGYVGISQFHEGNKIERVLLTKAQMKALLKFSGLTKRAVDLALPSSNVKVLHKKSSGKRKGSA